MVDSRQVLKILMNEPRFLSITPDLGLVDLRTTVSTTSTTRNSHSHNYELVKHFATHLIRQQNKTDFSYVAFPIVTSAWYNPSSYIPSPIIDTIVEEEDGVVTQVTNFPYSLAKWAGTSNATTTTSATLRNLIEDDEEVLFDVVDGAETTSVPGYWDQIRLAVRQAEQGSVKRGEGRDDDSDGNDDDEFPPFHCPRKARFGVTKDMARINYPLTKSTIRTILQDYDNTSSSSTTWQYDIDFGSGKIIRRQNGGENPQDQD